MFDNLFKNKTAEPQKDSQTTSAATTLVVKTAMTLAEEVEAKAKQLQNELRKFENLRIGQ